MQYRIYGEIGIHGAADYPDARRGASSWIFIHPSSSTPSSTLRILPDPTFFYRFVSTFTLASKLMISQKPVHSMKAMNRPYILLFNSYRLHRLCPSARIPVLLPHGLSTTGLRLFHRLRPAYLCPADGCSARCRSLQGYGL